jgi:hypothetical protein
MCASNRKDPNACAYDRLTAAAVIGTLRAALLEWANDPDAGPTGDAVKSRLALLEVRPLR